MSHLNQKTKPIMMRSPENLSSGEKNRSTVDLFLQDLEKNAPTQPLTSKKEAFVQSILQMIRNQGTESTLDIVDRGIIERCAQALEDYVQHARNPSIEPEQQIGYIEEAQRAVGHMKRLIERQSAKNIEDTQKDTQDAISKSLLVSDSKTRQIIAKESPGNNTQTRPMAPKLNLAGWESLAMEIQRERESEKDVPEEIFVAPKPKPREEEIIPTPVRPKTLMENNIGLTEDQLNMIPEGIKDSFTITKHIATEGQGSVYLAEVNSDSTYYNPTKKVLQRSKIILGKPNEKVELPAGKPYIIKVLSFNFKNKSPEQIHLLRAQLIRESQLSLLLSEKNIPHLLPVHHVVVEGKNEEPYQEGKVNDGTIDVAIVMEYAKGGSLRDAMTKQPLLLKEALEYVEDILETLVAVHKEPISFPDETKHEIVHRDIKPENILFNGKGEALLSDFGGATGVWKNEGFRPFTLLYSDPEQLLSSSEHPACDLYAIGIMLYEMISGKHPYFTVISEQDFAAIPNDMQKLFRIKNFKITDFSNIPEDIASIIKDCINSELSKRPSTEKVLERVSAALDKIGLLDHWKAKFSRFWNQFVSSQKKAISGPSANLPTSQQRIEAAKAVTEDMETPPNS